MAQRRRRSDYDGESHGRTEKRRRRLYLLPDGGKQGFSVYKLNVNDFDSDDDSDSDSGSDTDDDMNSMARRLGKRRGTVDDPESGSDDDVDSRARRLRRRRLVVRLEGNACQHVVAAGTKIFDFHSSPHGDGPSFVFDMRTRFLTTTPPFQSPKNCPDFWAVGNTIYALGSAEDDNIERIPEPCVFERLGPQPELFHGRWQWEALPPPPFKPGRHHVVSHAVHPDGSTLFLSVYDTGTFSFDGERRAWASHGGWLLPFDGEAHYVRELGAWVGLCSRRRGRIAACKVVDGGAAAEEPAWKSGKDVLFRQRSERHLEANLTYMGNAEFCLQETLKRKGHFDTFGLILPVLARVVTFRVQYSWDGELCVVDRRARVYKLALHSADRKPLAFWI